MRSLNLSAQHKNFFGTNLEYRLRHRAEGILAATTFGAAPSRRWPTFSAPAATSRPVLPFEMRNLRSCHLSQKVLLSPLVTNHTSSFISRIAILKTYPRNTKLLWKLVASFQITKLPSYMACMGRKSNTRAADSPVDLTMAPIMATADAAYSG